VQTGVNSSYTFAQGPLFSYLYFVRPLPTGHSVMAAMLLEAQLAGRRRGHHAFCGALRAISYGLRPRFTSPERARGQSIWDWSTDRAILSVSFATLTQQHWWERVVERGRVAVGIAWGVGFLLLSLLWFRRSRAMPAVPVAMGTAGVLLLPLGHGAAGDSIFSPLLFVLPGPVDVTLGMLLLLLAGSAVLLLTRGKGTPKPGIPAWVAAPLAGLACVAALAVVGRSAASGLLAGQVAGGPALQVATTLLIAIPLFLLLESLPRRPGRASTMRLLGGLATALLLAAAIVLLWSPSRNLSVWTAAAWAIPFWLVANGAAVAGMPRRRLLRHWMLAAWLAASATIPHLWVLHTSAELEMAEGELSRLGTETDPFLNFLLRQFSERATAYHEAGEEGVNLLYHSWVSSGLAREGYEASLGIWLGDQPETELRLSEVAAPADVIAGAVREFEHAGEPVIERYTDVEGLHYLLLVTLPDSQVVSVVVPPRYRTGRSTALARFLQPGGDIPGGSARDGLYLLPISTEEREEVEAGALDMRDVGVEWSRVPNGWRSEARAHFPAGWMHAHLLVRTIATPILAVRGLLLLIGLLALSLALWLAGRSLCGELPEIAPLRRRWLRSFRGRLTARALPLLPRADGRSSARPRTARWRERWCDTAGRPRAPVPRSRPPARSRAPRSAEVGRARRSVDLLLFRRWRARRRRRSPEVLDLGIFHTWLPPEVYLELRPRGGRGGTARSGGWRVTTT
jgi:hypothetical protein